MKINKDFVNKIFNQKLKLNKQSDKIKLSKFGQLIPMYDIYSQQIYPITNENIHYRLINSHYRFINSEVKKWIENQLKKQKDEKSELYLKLKRNLDIINNYDLKTLEETSYQTLYQYSPKLGLSVSICKRNSFHPYSIHLTPYYTKDELIKLGQNMGIVKNITSKKLIDKELHYKICKKVSKNDISNEEISKHTQYIIDSEVNSWLSFYSFNGSYLYNKFLRNDKKKMSSFMHGGLNKIVNCIKNAPALEKNYFIYRFLWDDIFLQGLKIGQSYVEPGFLSTTRDPFYSPGIEQNFGLILVKIYLPKNKKGIGLLMENFSLFPKEEEFLLPPNCSLKLKSKDDKFKYYHTNKSFENVITTKYEFTLGSIDYNSITKIKPTSSSIQLLQLDSIELNGNNRIYLFNQFFTDYTNQFKEFKLKVDKTEYIFRYNWFDSTESYSRFYYNKMKDGVIFNCFKDGYPIISVECGDEMVINFVKKYYYPNTYFDELLLEIYAFFARIFKYREAKIFLDYHDFREFNQSNYAYNYLYCHPIYQYAKNKTKFTTNKFISYPFGYRKLDKIFSSKVPSEVNIKLNKELSGLTWKELYIKIIENHFYLYPKLEEWLDVYYHNFSRNYYLIFDVETYLLNKGHEINIPPDFVYSENQIDTEDYKLVFRQPIRRII